MQWQILHSQIPPKLQKLGGEERKNKVNSQRTPTSRSTMLPSLREDIDWGKCRSRSHLSFPSRRCKNYRRNRELGQALKVNNGGKRLGKKQLALAPWGRRVYFIDPHEI
jgi:hypothetical protein